MALFSGHSFLAVVAIALVVAVYRYRNWRQGILKHRRRASIVTPPRSLSPEKGSRESAAVAPPSPGYKESFPPSGRENLVKVLRDATPFLNENEFYKSLIPFTSSYWECGPSTFTPTGISIAEVKALGDFPDYAVLADVPLPNVYEGFKLDQAIARPYRPFRWAYHQTMCMSSE